MEAHADRFYLLLECLEDFNRKCGREQQKKLLNMIISELTINVLREANSIKININDNLINYLSKEEGVWE